MDLQLKIIENKRTNCEWFDDEIPLISIRDTHIVLNDRCAIDLRLDRNSEIAFALSKNNELFLSDVTNNNIKGYPFVDNKSWKRLHINKPWFLKTSKIKNGFYVVDTEPRFDDKSKIDWFKLNPAE